MNGNTSDQYHFSLQHSESQIFRGACQIYSGYIAAGKVSDGDEERFMEKSVEEAIRIASTVDDCINSDDELKNNKLGGGLFSS